MAQRIQLRRDTAAEWINYNPILAEIEIGYETDTMKWKVGDGVSTWSMLAYADLPDHDHNDIYYTEIEINTFLLGKSDTGHQHTESDITDLDKYTQLEVDNLISTHNHNLADLSEKEYTSLDNIPATFPPEAHTHAIADVTGLQTILDGVDSLIFSAGRNSFSVTNLYLSDGNGIPTNTTPYIVPWDCTLHAIGAACNSATLWQAEIHLNGVLIPGATLVIPTAVSAYRNDLDLNLSAGDAISIYCRGSGVRYPRVVSTWRRRV